MAVFGNYIVENSDIYESVLPDVDAESLMMDESVEPCQEDNFLVASARICAESTENMNRIMEACAIQEFCYFEENGVEMVYEGNAITSFIDKAKAFFLKLWQKIQGIFKKAVMMFSAKAKDDKAFYSKYKTELNKAKAKDYGDKEVSIYKYIFYTTNSLDQFSPESTGVDDEFASNSVTKVCDAAGTENVDELLGKIANKSEADLKDDQYKKVIEDLRDRMSTIQESDWKEDCKDKVRGELVQKLDSKAPDSITASEFNKEIAEACQGDSSKDTVNLSDAVSLVVPYLENSKKLVDTMDKWLKSWKRMIDKELTALKKAQRDFDKEMGKKDTIAGNARVAGYKHTILSAAISLDESRKNIGVSFHSAVIQQLKACSGQAKAICIQAVHYKKPKNESYSYTEESTGSLLDNIELI